MHKVRSLAIHPSHKDRYVPRRGLEMIGTYRDDKPDLSQPLRLGKYIGFERGALSGTETAFGPETARSLNISLSGGAK
jgi:hypothetical protein